MIKFSKRTRYAVKCLIHLHAYRDRGVISVQSISQIQQIPEKFLGSILNSLKKNGWVKSRQGPNGGYYLTENIQQLRLKEIIEDLETKTHDSDEVNATTDESQISEKVILDSLVEMNEIITEHVSHLTLGELSKRYSRLLDNKNQMYSI